MASYQGGKQKIGKYIYNTIIELENKINILNDTKYKLPYLEPFVGFCGVLKHFANDTDRDLEASDINPDIINMWKALQDGWIPDGKCSKKKYDQLKVQEKSTPERTFYGHVCSFGGIFFNSFINNGSRDYAKMGTRSIIQIAQQVERVHFKQSDYQKLRPRYKLIYCDPPYKNNQIRNKMFSSFDSEEFWEIMRKWSKQNIVVISELTSPHDFQCIWEISRPTLAARNHSKTKQRHTEKLFIHKSLYDLLI
jgi:site-specific DNA-adenine methylase